SLVAVPALMYAWGSWHGESRPRETGLLSGEALLNSLAVNEALKVVFARQRPTSTGGQGQFFTADIGKASFPSTHSMLSWTAASVIAHEYPGPVTQVLAYGGAAAVSISRVTGRKHFPADVVVGAAAGWLIGHQVYKAHHDPELEAPAYGSFVSDPKEFDPEKLGSPFVPLDSWVYPALERLAAMGYIKTQFVGLRPWTRRECVRQIEEAEYFAQSRPEEPGVSEIIDQLNAEFSRDGQHYQSISLDSIYNGYTNISGQPIRNSYHFGQTIWNDFGRPFDQGSNFYSGASLSAVAGRFFWYVRGEYQHAPGRAGLTDAQQTFVNCKMDDNCSLSGIAPPPAAPVSEINRFYPLDMYAGMQMGEYAMTFGKQSLWLGPGKTGPLMVGDNADPMYMLRLSRATPLVLPGFFRHLGEIRGEFLFAKLSGHQFPPRPFFNLQKFSFHPTKNLEIGFTRASLWAGVFHPFTARALKRNFFALGDTPVGPFNQRDDIGDRKSGFDFSYRIPGLRNWLTIYSDMYSDDDPSPLANPRRAAVNPGFYLSHVPGVSKLDLRGEFVSTQSLTGTDRDGQFLYFNFRYHDSNTNKGNLFGNQTGRDGRTYQASTTYHFSAMTTLQFSYRTTKTSALFPLPGGGTQSDAGTRFLWQIRPDWSVDAFVQYERWLIPFLRPTAQQDVTSRIQLTFTPHRGNVIP
ncbi:MAG TPA: capsule assembly Wzi family protein, partial [Bryobacteraceae bacterium]|nr:capsule assembly Wzi family protein [Bryobacteraceae bacterium]